MFVNDLCSFHFFWFEARLIRRNGYRPRFGGRCLCKIKLVKATYAVYTSTIRIRLDCDSAAVRLSFELQFDRATTKD